MTTGKARDSRDNGKGPTKEQVIQARMAAHLNQTEAADLVYLSSFSRWSEYERGDRNMDEARFELFQIKTGQHPEYGPVKKPMIITNETLPKHRIRRPAATVAGK